VRSKARANTPIFGCEIRNLDFAEYQNSKWPSEKTNEKQKKELRNDCMKYLRKGAFFLIR
jgi:hypothetical protein